MLLTETEKERERDTDRERRHNGEMEKNRFLLSHTLLARVFLCGYDSTSVSVRERERHTGEACFFVLFLNLGSRITEEMCQFVASLRD